VVGKGDRARLKLSGAAVGELRLLRRSGHWLLPLSELAPLVDAEILRPARRTEDGSPAPVKPGDWVYLLARVRSVRVEEGAVRIDTSFPVPARAVTDAEANGSEELVECLGATVPEGFAPVPPPADEKRVRSLSVDQPRPGVVRVKLTLAQTSNDVGGPSGAGAAVEPLELPDFLRQVQAYYPKLSAADAQRRTAAAKRLEKEGAFDPRFFGGSDVFRFPSSDKPGALKSFTSTEAGVEFLTPYGIKVVTGGRINRGDVKSPLSVTGDSGEYFVGVKVPLLGGAGINEKLAALRQSRLGEPLADADFELFRLEVLLKAAGSYWDWVAAGQRVDVALELLELAQVRAQAVAQRAESGDLPLIDVVEARQEVQRRSEGLHKAERELQKETFKLSLFLWDAEGRSTELPSARRIPRVPPPAGELPEAEIEAGRAAALELRPELRALVASRKITQVSLDLARNQRLPAVELSLAPGVDTGSGGAGGTVKAGVSVGLPLRQRTAEGRIEEARLKLEKLDLDFQLERQRVVTEVEDAVSAVRQAYRRYQAATQELELARRLEEAERERFALGDSTLFLVNQRERASGEAAVKAITLRAEYEQSVALFRAVTTQL
jgi:outer membrane protein TolC